MLSFEALYVMAGSILLGIIAFIVISEWISHRQSKRSEYYHKRIVAMIDSRHPYHHRIAHAYKADDIVCHCGRWHYANGDIPANTPFLKGKVGPTWSGIH